MPFPFGTRQRCKTKKYLWVFFVAFICYLHIVFLLNRRSLSSDKDPVPVSGFITDRDVNFVAKILPQCACRDPETGLSHNFCYHLPFNRSSFGRRFDCKWLPFVKKLGLLDERPENYVRLERGDFPKPVFLTACSDSHFAEEKRLIFTIQQYLPSATVVFYDLGLNEANVLEAKSFCQVLYRKFRFELFPDYVSKLHHFRWKPLIIAEGLREFGTIWYMDSSVVLKKRDLSHVEALVKCHSRSLEERTNGKGPLTTVARKESWIESGFHVQQWQVSVANCDKFAYMLQGFTGHGIFPVTHPRVYEYIPTNLERLKGETAKMYEAGFIFAVRTTEVIRDAVKWYVLCALENGCMAPAESTPSCHFSGSDRYATFANCHRFDQSVINLLLANSNHFDRYYYTSGIVDFFNIVRGSGTPKQPRTCSKL